MFSQLIFYLWGEIFWFWDYLMIYKWIVFGVNNQCWFGDLVQYWYGVILMIIVDSVGVVVNFGGDEIVKFMDVMY